MAVDRQAVDGDVVRLHQDDPPRRRAVDRRDDPGRVPVDVDAGTLQIERVVDHDRLGICADRDVTVSATVEDVLSMAVWIAW